MSRTYLTRAVTSDPVPGTGLTWRGTETDPPRIHSSQPRSPDDVQSAVTRCSSHPDPDRTFQFPTEATHLKLEKCPIRSDHPTVNLFSDQDKGQPEAELKALVDLEGSDHEVKADRTRSPADRVKVDKTRPPADRVKVDKIRSPADSETAPPPPDPAANDSSPLAERARDDWSTSARDRMGGASTDPDPELSDRGVFDPREAPLEEDPQE